MKLCSKCKQLLSLECFFKNSNSRDGLRPSCFSCDSKVRAKWRDNNRKRIAQVNMAYKLKNKTKVSYWAVKVNKKRRHTNDEVKKVHRIRGMIYTAIKRNYKNSYITEYIGCSLNEYKDYIEKQFINNMNWTNRGIEWEIDHITPIKQFNCLDENECKKAFHFSNTQVIKKIDHKQKTKLENKVF